MIKIIDSKIAARKTIKAELEKEIPPINEAIEKATSDGKTFFNYEGEISEPTVKMLNEAGYEVNGWSSRKRAQISLSRTYDEICNTDGEVERIAKELHLVIMQVHQPLKQEK